VKQILTCGLKLINAKDEMGKTVIHHVCESKKIEPEILRLLIEAGAHVNTYDLMGNKPIHV
jgi:ankyrin repeat protein